MNEVDAQLVVALYAEELAKAQREIILLKAQIIMMKGGEPDGDTQET